MKFLMTYHHRADAPPPTPEQMQAIGELSREMFAAGKMIMTGGLVRPSAGLKVRFEGGEMSVTDGPFAETKELIDGFALMELGSMDEAIEQVKRFMTLAGEGEGEILQVFDAPPEG